AFGPLLQALQWLTCCNGAVRRLFAAFGRASVLFCVNVLMARFNRAVLDGKQIPAKGAPCSAFGERLPAFTMSVLAVWANSSSLRAMKTGGSFWS
ncbi:hypothetical protein ABG977_06160, partial [Collinsella aerofaciens]|uniref:hypothetical protein n=1 Tax=Collinsella aerofaciens TaxID=74426 RepID=UPI00325B0D60